MQRSYTAGFLTCSEEKNRDSKQAVSLLTAPCPFPFRIFVDLPLSIPDANVWLKNDDAYNAVPWLGQNNRDSDFKMTLFFYVATTGNVPPQQLYGLILK